jgi:TPR repeat protein
VVKQLRRAAEAQLPTAIYLLGVLTESGLGVPRDPAVAAQLYHDAAEKGHRSAQVRWGLKLLEGRYRTVVAPRGPRGRCRGSGLGR